jgi:CheY-like chemotaxis protein
VRQGHILIVDDLERWREGLVKALQREGFHADTIDTTRHVLKRLDEALYHLVVLDISMEATDPNNTDGIDLLRDLERQGLSEAVKIIMLSAYGTKEQMRLAFKKYSVADFLDKVELNKQIFLDSVQQAFSSLNINLSLDIHWEEVRGPEQAVLNLEMDDGIRVEQNTPLQSSVAFELDDLLCRLFYKAKSIIVRPMTPGQSATGLLWVQPFYDEGSGRAFVVKFGNIHKIKKEYSNFTQYIQSFVGGGHSTNVHDLRQTPHLAGIMYSFMGVANDRLEDFGSFYRDATVAEIKEVLDKLFQETCSHWYASPGRLRPHDLAADYRQLLNYKPEKLEQGLAELRVSMQPGMQKLYLRYLSHERAFTNPLLVIAGRPLVCSTYTCTTHGDFNQHNILIDSNRNIWLIDFLRTGRGHILRDVSELDSIVRFELLASGEATMEERLKMEEVLCSIERFSQVEQLEDKFPTENQALAKVYATVVHLRKQARKLVMQNPDDNIREYHIALLYHAVNTLRFNDLSIEQREHALLCASLLADRLGLKG